jgi:hypothetical protein
MPNLTSFLTAHYDVIKDFSGPLATAIAASVAALVALRLGSIQTALSKTQAAIAHDKLKFDLFALRYDIYTKAIALIEYSQTIHEYEKIDHPRFRAFYVKLDEARFFFDTTTILFLDEIHQTCEKRIELLNDRYGCYEASEEFLSSVSDQLAVCDSTLRNLYSKAPAAFEAALKFNQVIDKQK